MQLYSLLIRNPEMHELDDRHRRLQALDWCAATHRMGAFFNLKTVYWRSVLRDANTIANPSQHILDATDCTRVLGPCAINMS
jgi:hypothetical protein